MGAGSRAEWKSSVSGGWRLRLGSVPGGLGQRGG